MNIVTALLAGFIFGFGLILSGMGNPSKVLGFLDILGAWDPSLGLVMAGAIAVTLPAFALLKKRQLSLLALPLQWPSINTLSPQLVIGSSLFGIGWGLVGFCPGPALLSLSIIPLQAFIFVGAMLIGMALFQLYNRFFAS